METQSRKQSAGFPFREAARRSVRFAVQYPIRSIAVVRFVCCALPLFLAGALSGAELTGQVRSGQKPIPGAVITATLDAQKVATTTDESGVYGFTNLAKGKWLVKVEMFGFTAADKEATAADAATRLDFDLELSVAGVAEEAAAQVVEEGTEAAAAKAEGAVAGAEEAHQVQPVL